MSQLHRNIFAAIVAGLEPVVAGAVAAFVPGGAAAGTLIQAGAQAVETIADDVAGDDAPAPTVTVAGATIVSPFPAAAPAAAAPVAAAPAPLPAPVQTSGLAPAAVAAAPAPAAAGAALTALDVIAALMQTLQALQARAAAQ